MRLTVTFFPVFLACFFMMAVGATAQKGSSVKLRGGVVTFSERDAQSWIDSFRKSAPGGDAQVLLGLPLRADANYVKRFAAAGVTLSDYVGNNTYLALIHTNGTEKVSTGLNIAPMPARAKWTSSSLPSSGDIDVAITIFSVADLPTLQSALKSIGGRLKPSPMAAHSLYIANLPAQKILLLAAAPFIKTIGPAANIQDLNAEAQKASKNNLAHSPVSSGGYGLLGDSITIGVGDNIPAIFHVDTRDRVNNFNDNFATFTNHGQHVNGTVGGAGTLDPAAEGYAPHARLLDHSYDNVLARAGVMQQDFGMSVTNNSYANVVGDCSFAGTYDAYAQALDTIALEFPDILHVFAAGNDGNLSCMPYPAGFGTVTGGYQPAKNVIVVGNVTRRYDSYFNSSRGPTKDGRIKPEIVVAGSNVYSTGKFDTYLEAGATSFSSPQISGASGLLQQRYKQLHGGAYPSADLLKCLLMNGALDIGNPGPDYTNGFGMLDMARSLSMIDNSRYFSNNIIAYTAQTATIPVPAGLGQLKVMLYWHDVPASPLADSQLVNDLDLEVTEPNTTLHHPLVLNAAPTHVLDNAAEGADHLNNVEQVVINNPAAGNYSIKVKSSAITGANQRYVIGYDFIPDAAQITFPNTGAVVKAGDSLRIYWDAPPATQPFTIEFSSDGGGTWSALGTAPPGNRFFVTLAPAISSEQCRVRISRGSQQSVSGNFVINPQPVLSLSAIQCPGYINLQWSTVPNATSYQVWRKKGFYLQPEAIVTGTTCSIAGLAVDSLYYVAVQPLINGVPGYRSLGVKRIPNDGTCSGTFSDGDLAIQKVLLPQNGRQSTSTQLSATQNFSLLVANHDDAAAGSYSISYRINGGAWQSSVFSTPIPAASSLVVPVASLDLSAAGNYYITAAITNLAMTDPVHANDTITYTIRQLANAQVDLNNGVTDDFETTPLFDVRHDSTGIINDRWDFYNSTDSGRIRSFVTSDVLISGNRSVSMDAILNLGPIPVASFLTATYNAGAYNTANEIRLQFDYKLHGRPKYLDSNAVWVRGSDTDPWKILYRYDTTVSAGVIQHSGSLSVTAALVAAGQAFSTSTQVRFGQQDTGLISLNDYGNGLTLDNVRLYSVQNDVALTDIITPKNAECALAAATPLTVTIHNSAANPQANVAIYYRIDGGALVMGNIPSIAGNATITYTFTNLLTAITAGAHTLNVWLYSASDTYHENDSILNYTFRNEPLITAFPYLQNFEENDGYYYTGGQNSSWAYGSPASAGVRRAASGTKAWKTNLTGNYNNNELSYLYSPCFDVSGLKNPMLSFSAVINVEDCGASLCDAAWVDYSSDGGSTWARLGAAGQGYNWYNDTARNIWKTQGNNRWHVASIALPKAASLRFRFVLSADPGTGFEGFAIDDVHLYDKAFPIYEGGNTGAIIATTNNTQWSPFLKNGGVITETHSLHNGSLSVEAQLYAHTNLTDSATNKYFAPRSYTLKPATQASDSLLARLYITDTELLTYLHDTTCVTCTRAEDTYRLGIRKYDDADKTRENGTLSDNKNGTYSFIPYNKIAWVPYDRGYYAQIAVASFSEFWFYDAQPVIMFDAQKISNVAVQAKWTSIIDSIVAVYDLQRSDDNAGNYTTIYSASGAQRASPAFFNYIDTPGASVGKKLYYRLHWRLTDSRDFYSQAIRIDWTAPNSVNAVYPNPVHNEPLYLQWSANTGTNLRGVITDITGKKVRDFSATSTAWNNNLSVDMGGIAPGIYILHTTIGGSGFTNKIVVR